MPVLKITDVVIEKDDKAIREKTTRLFGIVIHKRIEQYPIQKERTIGFTSDGTRLTYIEDD